MLKLVCVAACMAMSLPSARAQDGSLVIVGGALDPDNEAVHRAFIERAGDAPRFAIIPVASGYPSGSGSAFAAQLVRYGVTPDAIEIVSLAVVDDPETPDVDESEWAQNARNPAEIARVESASGIWFVGGDQVRIASALLTPDGADTPMLAAMRARLADGAVIGGTSAGAAMMGRLMIARGEPLASLFEPVSSANPGADVPDTEALVMAAGLGFFPAGITDQHFDARARLGRLARAVSTAPEPFQVGFGVDEDTALVYDLASESLTVLGAGSASVVDARTALVADPGDVFAVSGLQLSVLNHGDRLDLGSGVFTPAAYKSATIGREYNDRPVVSGGGMAVPAGRLEDMLGAELVDNAGAEVLERASFAGERGVIFRFRQTPQSRGYWGRDSDGRSHYSVLSIDFDILPVTVTFGPVNPTGDE